MTATTETLLRTPLYNLHVELGARMVPFAGYEMPVQYPMGVLKEHNHTRAQAGLFDVSHMGQVRMSGANAAAALESLVPIDVIDLGLNCQRYAMFTNERGGILDDLMVSNAGDSLFVVVNAACKQQDIAHLRKHLAGRCTIEELADRSLLALQGPTASNASSAVPVTPVKTVLKFRFQIVRPRNWPDCCWRKQESHRSAWARVIRYASKPGYVSTATTWTPASRRSRQV
jgi:glycine cleavage system aminomethyltransferase T